MKKSLSLFFLLSLMSFGCKKPNTNLQRYGELPAVAHSPDQLQMVHTLTSSGSTLPTSDELNQVIGSPPECDFSANPVLDDSARTEESNVTSPSEVAGIPEGYKIPDNLILGNECTIVFSRHAETKLNALDYADKLDGVSTKERLALSAQLSTEKTKINGFVSGEEQAKNLKSILNEFEQNKNYSSFDNIFMSPLDRVALTLDPFLTEDKKKPETWGDLAECVKESECESRFETLIPKINEYCKKKDNGTPRTILLGSHGEIGKKLIRKLIPDLDYKKHPLNGKPIVLTRSEGEGFKLLHD